MKTRGKAWLLALSALLASCAPERVAFDGFGVFETDEEGVCDFGASLPVDEIAINLGALGEMNASLMVSAAVENLRDQPQELNRLELQFSDDGEGFSTLGDAGLMTFPLNGTLVEGEARELVIELIGAGDLSAWRDAHAIATGGRADGVAEETVEVTVVTSDGSKSDPVMVDFRVCAECELESRGICVPRDQRND